MDEPVGMHPGGPRVLLFTGKGGVGKTTTAAATALHLAARGQRVVVTSADPAHSLADALGVELGSDLEAVAPRCDAQQLDALQRMEVSWGEIRSWLVDVFDWAGLSAVEAEELAVFPGFEELVALLEIERLVTAGDHDVVVVDCAPTAESIRLLSLPDVLDWYMRRLFPASRRLSRLVGPVVSRFTDVPVAGAEVFDAAERFHRQLARVSALLTDPTTTSARIVVTPERMAVAEARRTLTYLSLFGYHVDAVVVNRVLPSGSDDPFLASWRAAQAEQLLAIESGFAPLRLLCAEANDSEILGADELALHGEAMWGGVDPLDRLSDGTPMCIEHRDGTPVLVLALPHVTGDEVDLVQSSGAAGTGELAVGVGPYRRNLALPDSLRGRPVQHARVCNDALEVHFGEAVRPRDPRAKMVR